MDPTEKQDILYITAQK